MRAQFLQDTLDTLFGILDESSQRYGLKVFDSLVSGVEFSGSKVKKNRVSPVDSVASSRHP